jgi:hypothetical protein
MTIVHWVTNHPFGAFTIFSWVVGLTLNTIARSPDDPEKKPVDTWLNTIGTTILTVWVFVASILFITRLIALLKFASDHLVLPSQVPVTAVTIVLVGVGLFVFRVCAIDKYGWAEVAFALASIWVSVSKAFAAPHDSNSWIAIVGAAYLLVRGLDNATSKMVKLRKAIQLLPTQLKNLIRQKFLRRSVPLPIRSDGQNG